MSQEEYWTGDFGGSRHGAFTLDLRVEGKAATGKATMRENGLSEYRYLITGNVDEPTLLQLTPDRSSPQVGQGVVEITGSLKDELTMVGRWASTNRYCGDFRARRYSAPVAKIETGARAERLNVFISYSHKDSAYLERVRVHLKPLQRAGIIDDWSDTKIKAGDMWKREIEAALNSSRVAILLISADFMGSDFIANKELPTILERAESHGSTVLSLLVGPSRFAREPSLSKFQAINDPLEYLSGLPTHKQEMYFDKLAERVESLVHKT